MKRLFAFIIILVLTLQLSACGLTAKEGRLFIQRATDWLQWLCIVFLNRDKKL